MLHVSFCISHFHPIASGAERQAQRQGRELVRRGHRVMVLTREVAGQPERETIDGVEVHRVIRPRAFGPLFGLTFVTTLRRALLERRGEFDIVHCHQALWEAVATGWAAKKLGRPIVVQPAAGGEFGEIRQLERTRGRGVLRKLILRNSHFVAISEQIERELVELGVPRDRLTRLASGVDVDEFSPGASTLDGKLPPRPRVLFLGRLAAQKNLSMLLAAWREVRRQVAASLVLAGEGPDRAALESQARELGIADSVHFIGPIADAVAYLRAADLFVLPSVAEGMSNSLLEAMSVGVPPIVSQIGGNADLVTDSATGVLVDPHDPAAWSRALVELLADDDRRRDLGSAARYFVRRDYSIRCVVDRYVALYERLLSRR